MIRLVGKKCHSGSCKKEGRLAEVGGKETNEVQAKNDKKSREQQGGEKSGAGISNRMIKLAC